VAVSQLSVCPTTAGERLHEVFWRAWFVNKPVVMLYA
jgi:hypothetical protein